ncbi:MAG: hypothetical protein L7H00_01075 [Vulcanisaeta sp.]|nr:hypothetical protein [Vulcanisaeta sp.]MCG2892103.1 hypothetical protein [Vulcanisaeta sp.]
MVLRNDRLREVALELGNWINEVLQLINGIHAYSPDKDLVNRLARDLRDSSKTSFTRGNPVITSKVGSIEVVYVLTASGYRDVMLEVINYYTNLLMAIKHVMEVAEKLGVDNDYTVFIDSSSIDVIIGYSIQDVSRTPLFELSSLRESIAIESVLGSVAGLRADELADVMNALDNAISAVSNNSLRLETVIKLDNINYPSPFRDLESKLGGAV